MYRVLLYVIFAIAIANTVLQPKRATGLCLPELAVLF